MIRTMLFSLGVAAMLTLPAYDAANAQRSVKGPSSSHSGGAHILLGDGSVRSTRRGAQDLRGSRRTKSRAQQTRKKGPNLMVPLATGKPLD